MISKFLFCPAGGTSALQMVLTFHILFYCHCVTVQMVSFCTFYYELCYCLWLFVNILLSNSSDLLLMMNVCSALQE